MKTKKSIMAILIICSFLLITWLPCQADDVLCGCAKNENGQLRIIDCSSKCLESEHAVTLSGGAGGGGQTGQLACVTGLMRHPTETGADIEITNAKNVAVTKWLDVFNAFYVQTNPDNGDIYWGIQCKEGWINTGCNQSVEGSEPKNVDLPQYYNGCFSDNEEISYLDIFITCCKIL